MGVLALRADRADDAPKRAVRKFFELLARGDLRGARRLTHHEFTWFGREMTDETWRGERLARFVSETRLAISNTRRLSTDSIREMPVTAVISCFGGVREVDRVVFADVTRNGNTVTIVAVTSGEGANQRLLRVLDPEAFTDFVRMAAALARIAAPAASSPNSPDTAAHCALRLRN